MAKESSAHKKQETNQAHMSMPIVKAIFMYLYSRVAIIQTMILQMIDHLEWLQEHVSHYVYIRAGLCKKKTCLQSADEIASVA